MTTLLWLKAFHVAFMTAWFAGVFYLPRLFVNHAETQSKEVAEHLKGMEKRLLYFITPFALLTIGLGIALIHYYGIDWFMASKWLHVKLTLVILVVIYHAYCFKLVKDFQHNKNKRSGRFYRLFNELPVFALFGIIILVYVKPF
ncbi:CopD family protein [Colwellia sp. UCD-KL20]|uniref:CopD family protein n=1 Tax=Colwellia sp. UCD-KL20 TaxID=1917165 RepID=UPI000971225B|nr:CopD family protein [Colwellia sp. UCD-KL20]